MSEPIVKFRCPACGGKLSMEGNYYQEMVGTTIVCAHCQGQITVPGILFKPSPTAKVSHGVDVTQEINRPAKPTPVSRRCPFCKDVIGPGDKVCVKCGKWLTPA